MTHAPYKRQYLKKVPRRTPGSVAWYFKPKPEEIPKGWLERFGPTVRVPRQSELRVGGAVEEAHAVTDAAALFAEFNKMRRAPEAGGQWPHGSLRWVMEDYRKSAWYASLADATRPGYESCMKQIEDYADERAAARNGVYRPISAATTKGLQEFINRWSKKPTRQRQLKAMLSVLFQHAIETGVAETNPAKDLRLPRTKKGMKRQRKVVLWDQTFVTDAVKIAWARGLHEVAAWIQTMWDIGRRPTDLNNLIVLDEMTRLRLERGEITDGIYYDPWTKTVRGWQQKTGSYGSIPLDDLTVQLIEACRPKVELGANQRHVFIDSRFGEPFTLERFAFQFRPVAIAAGLEGTTPQMGRHSCIMRYRRAGHSYADIKEVTGHFDEKTIERFYVVQDDSRLQKIKAARAAAEGKK